MERITRIALVGLLLVAVVCSGCSPSLPLGEPQKYPAYSNGVIVGGIMRNAVTGQYSVIADGAPLPVTNFNDEAVSPAYTADESELQQLIGKQAHLLAKEEELREEEQRRAIEARPPVVQFAKYRARRLFIGPRLGRP